jgi:hypothetical protein
MLQKHISREDALASIRADYERNYFVSGEGELAAYDPECEFRDDFAAFNGVGGFNSSKCYGRPVVHIRSWLHVSYCRVTAVVE